MGNRKETIIDLVNLLRTQHFNFYLNQIKMSKQVTCISKTNRTSRYEAISHIGGAWGKHTQKEAIANIKADKNAYHVKVNGNDVKLIVATNNGNEYVKTESDATTVDNLLSLKECV